MANEKKSIIEEALLEAENIDATFKSNAKEILAHTMSSEIEEMVKESLTGSKKRLKEDEEEEIDLELDSNDEGEEEMDLDTEESDEDMDMEDEDMEDSDNEEMDMEDMDMDTEDEDKDMDMDFDLGGEDMDMEDMDMDLDLDLGDETEDEGMMEPMDAIDLTKSSDSDVISVFKKMGPEDEIEVVNDNGMVTLKDNKSGSEYRIELNSRTGEVGDVEMSSMEEGLEGSNQVIYEIVMDDDDYEDEDEDYMMNPNEDYMGEEDMDMDNEDEMSTPPMYMKRKKYDTNQELASMYGDKNKVTMGDVIAARKKGNEDGMSSDMDMKSYMNHDRNDYASRTKSTKGRYHVGNRTNPNAIARMGNNSYMGESKTPQISKLISENTILNESVSTLKSENNELKANQEKMVDALKQFRNKLQEVAVFNSNLTYAVRLFTEQSTTKDEKQEVLKRLDSAKSLKESQSIYKQLVKEFSNTRTPIKESIEEKLNKTSSSGASQISEQTVFVHPELQNMKKLWEYGYKK